ncbi:MAG: cyclic nucleotide-binding domain-containing protein [Myxococcota bacterium]
MTAAPEGLGTATWDALAPWLTEVRLQPGERLFREDDVADSLYVVRQGTLAIHFELQPDQLLDRVGPGQVVGERALLLGGHRSASGTAEDEVVALRLDRDRYETLVAEHPELGRDLSAALHERVRRTRLASHLQAILGDLGPEALREIQAQVEWVQLRSGEVLFRQGDPPDGAYILALGRLQVAVADGAGGERIVDQTAPGQWVGEMGLLAGQPRSATVYALRDSELVWLPKALFDDIVARWPAR